MVVVRKHRLKPDTVAAFIPAVEAAATLVSNVPEQFIYRRDSDDAHCVNLVLAVDATLIGSNDLDLLD